MNLEQFIKVMPFRKIRNDIDAKWKPWETPDVIQIER